MGFFGWYAAVCSAIAFVLMGVDKRRARRHLWRIPEATLMLFAVIGGSVGAILGMLLFRHKTRHAKFAVGLPVILFLQIVACILVHSLLPGGL